MDNMENEENIITASDIFRTIRKRIWIVAAVSIVCCILFFCFAQFWYNSNNQNYKATCFISFPGVYSGSTQSVYPDGSVFRAEDIISYSNLSYIKEQGGDLFASIDVEKMVQNDGISVSLNYANTTVQSSALSQSSNQTTAVQTDAEMTITVSASYFENADQAREFIRRVGNYPVLHAQELVATSSYDIYLQNYKSDQVTTYEQKIDSLISQHKYLLDMYDSLIDVKGAYYIVSFTTEDGKTSSGTLDSYRASCNTAFSEDEQQALIEELDVNGYVFDMDSYEQEAESRLNVLNGKIEDLEFRILEYNNMLLKLQSEGAPDNLITQISQLCGQLAQEKNLYALERDKIQSNLENPPSDEEISAFNAKLDSYAEILKEQTQIYKSVRTQYFEQESYFRMQNNKLSVTGGISPVLAIIGGLVIGFIAACVVVCIVDLNKQHKIKAVKSESEETSETEKSESQE